LVGVACDREIDHPQHTEAQAMLTQGASLSVIARTLKLKISDILSIEIEKAAK